MMKWVRRAAEPMRYAVMICAFFGLLSLMTGCGLVSAVANPKVAWAIQDPAGMSVVVRRADAADATAKQVDRILTATPASPDSDWLKAVGPKPEDAVGDVKALVQNPMYAKTHARVVPAEIWALQLGDIRSTDGSSPNLLAMVSSDLGDAYAAIQAKTADIADLKAQVEAEKTAKDAKDATDADKKEHDKNIDDLQKQISKLEDEVDPLKKKFLEAAKTAAGKASADTRKALGPVLVNLHAAVEDASIADGAAAVRYPLALKSLPDALQEIVPVIVADIVEEQSGHRPTMNGFKPDVKLDGLDVKLTLNGLDQSDLGKLSIGDLTTETLSRTKKWVVHAVTLLGAVASTKTQLSFEQDTLDALIDGFAANGWTKTEAAKIPDEKDPKVASATAKVRPHVKPGDENKATGVAEAQKNAKPATTTDAKTTDTPSATTKGNDKPGNGADKSTGKKPGKSGASTKPTSGSNKTPPAAGGKDAAPVRPEDFNP
jgi:prefoldin subunit 5